MKTVMLLRDRRRSEDKKDYKATGQFRYICTVLEASEKISDKQHDHTRIRIELVVSVRSNVTSGGPKSIKTIYQIVISKPKQNTHLQMVSERNCKSMPARKQVLCLERRMNI